MANETRLGREGVVAITVVPAADVSTSLGREGVVAATVRPANTIDMRMGRVGVYVLMSRPHGWDVFADSPMIAP